MADRFVIVHRSYDPIQADLLGDLLREAGIAARVTGTRGAASIGVGQSIVEMQIAVPESQAGDATDFLEAYFAGEWVVDDELADPADEDSVPGVDQASGDVGDDESKRPLRAMFAAGATFLSVGGGLGHYYARRPWSALCFAAGLIFAVACLTTPLGDGVLGVEHLQWSVGATILAGLFALDFVGSLLAVRAYNRGIRMGRSWQLAMGGLSTGLAIGFGVVVGPALTEPTRGVGTDDHTEGTRGWGGPAQSEIGGDLGRGSAFPPLTSQHPANPQAR